MHTSYKIELDQPAYKKIESIAQSSTDYISFSQGALRTGGVPAEIKQYASTILTSDHADYYTHVLGLYALREKLTQVLNQRYQTHLTIDNLMISHGSINGISAVCLALLQHGDEVLVPEPTYPAYYNIIKLAKADPVFVQGFIEHQNRWHFMLDRIIQATTARTKMIILPNPSNPAGVCLQQEDLIGLKQWCERKNIYLIFDEVYENYVFGNNFVSSTPLVLDSRMIIRTGSFSKDFAMSGWRVGFVVAPKELITTLAAVQDGLICCPTAISQYAALYALDNPHLMTDQINQISNNKELICTLLQPLKAEGIFSFSKPDAGFFLFLKTTEHDTTELVAALLNRAKVALVPGKDFGPSGKSYIRLCYARDQKLIEEGINRLYDFFGLISR